MARMTNIIKTCDLYAPNRDRNFYDDYVDGLLSATDLKKFEKHLATCLHCSRKVIEAIERDEAVEASYDLSEIGLRNSRKKKMQWRKEILSQYPIPEEYTALAASPPRRMDVQGVAYGVAVDPATGHGDLLECIAVVADNVKARSKLEIRARELRGLKRSGVEERITTPADHLENILTDIFMTCKPLLPLRLWENTIRVEVNNKSGCGVIHEPDSAALAILVAIVSAVTGKKVDNNILFSAGIKINGFLEGVGDIVQKIHVAKCQGMKVCVTAEETRPTCADKSIKKSGIALYYFNTMEDVLNSIGLIGKETKRASRKSNAISRKNKK